MLKVGLIGNGNIAQAHWKGYKQIAAEGGGVTVEACCDIRPERLEGLEGLRLYTDVAEMLEKEKGQLDYVDICVPTYLHAEIAVKAMKAGFHVLSEKPMARTVEETQEMIKTAKETNKTLMSAYCNRFFDAARAVREVILSGELGPVRSADFFREGGFPSGWNNWFLDGQLSGGAMLDLHIHDVDMIRWMFGMPKAVSAAAASYVTKNGYDTMSVNFHYDSDVFVHASCSWVTEHNSYNTRSFRVNFEKGYLFADRSPGRQTFVKVGADGTVTDLSDKLAFNAYYNEIVYFADCLSQGRPVTECLPEETADSVRMVMTEMESAAQQGAKIAL